MKNRIAPKIAVAISAAVVLILGPGASHGQQDGGGRIYWTEEKDLGWIQRADLDGGNVESVITTDIQTELQMDQIFLLAVDTWGEKIYWAEWDSEKSTFRRADLWGGNVETLVPVTMEGFISALALDPFGGKLYWGEWDGETSIIRRADLNGSNVETIVAGIEDYVYGIVLDGFEEWAHSHGPDMQSFEWGVPATKMYWTEAGIGAIRRSDPDGSNIETLLTGMGSPAGILLDGSEKHASFQLYRRMYWADWETNTIRRANLDGSDIQTLVTGQEGSIFAFALKESWGAIYWTEMNSDSYTTILKGADMDGNYVGVVKEIEEPINFALDPISENEGFYFSRRGSNTISYGFHDEEPISLGMEGGAGSIAVDTSADMLYWLDNRTRSIRRTNLDGTDVEEVVTGLEDAKDIALDLVAGKMYWTEQGTGEIRRANLDGTDVESFLTGIENPEGIALDIPWGKVYWTVRGASSRFPDSGMVQRANLDGTNVETLLAGLRDPDDIALDPYAGMMYLYVRKGYYGAGIFRANLDGSGGKFIAVGIGSSRIALDLVGRKMYWVNKGAGAGRIRRSDLDGANEEEVVTGLVRIEGIALDVPLPAMSTQTGQVSRTAVHATVEGGEVGGLTIEFVPTGSRTQADNAWRAVTDEAGRFVLDIFIRDPAGVSGLYRVRARNQKGSLAGTWEDILLEDGQRQILELTLGGGVKVVAKERLGEPNPDPCSNGIAVPYPRINRGLLEDCRAILASRDSWVGQGNSGWNAATPIDDWPGVEVRDSRVRGIRFGEWESGWPFPSLSGPSLSLLNRLTELERLTLSWESLTGPIPPELGQLTQLRELDLSENELTGPIPPELGQLTQLRSLDLYHNQLTGPIPPELSQLTQLRGLDLSGNDLMGPIPPELGQLTQLRFLYLGYNQLTGPVPPELGQLIHLELLFLGGNQLTGPIPPELGRLTQLRYFRLNDNQLTGPIPAALGQLTQLDAVELDDNLFTCVPETLSMWADDLPVCEPVDLDLSEVDFDGDGAVGFGDFFLFADAFGGSDSRFDLDDSGSVDFADFFLFADHFADPARAKLLALAREMIGLPDAPQLRNAPNPFNSRTVVSWFLLSPGQVRLEIYNTLGQRVRTLVDEVRGAGRHQVSWDARDQGGVPVAAGVYLSRLRYPGGVQTQRLLYLK